MPPAVVFTKKVALRFQEAVGQMPERSRAASPLTAHVDSAQRSMNPPLRLHT